MKVQVEIDDNELRERVCSFARKMRNLCKQSEKKKGRLRG